MEVLITRGTVVPFASLDNRTIALDGAVQGPAMDPQRERYSFDHHADCIRHCTRATCEQVRDALLLGLDPTGFDVLVNDVDGDTALSVWLLRNPKLAGSEQVASLVRAVGAIDAYGPVYPLSASETRLARTFFEKAMAPERVEKRTGAYGTCDLLALLETCLSGIDDMLTGAHAEADAGTIAPTRETQYWVELTGTGGWVLVRSNDFCFDALYRDGFTKAIVFTELRDGSRKYTVGKRSEFIGRFPVGDHKTPGTILHALCLLEPGWGGGTTIGGSPRNPDGASSRLLPSDVFALVERVLA